MKEEGKMCIVLKNQLKIQCFYKGRALQSMKAK